MAANEEDTPRDPQQEIEDLLEQLQSLQAAYDHIVGFYNALLGSAYQRTVTDDETDK